MTNLFYYGTMDCEQYKKFMPAKRKTVTKNDQCKVGGKKFENFHNNYSNKKSFFDDKILISLYIQFALTIFFLINKLGMEMLDLSILLNFIFSKLFFFSFIYEKVIQS